MNAPRKQSNAMKRPRPFSPARIALAAAACLPAIAFGTDVYFSPDGTGDGTSAESPKAFSAGAATEAATSGNAAILLDGAYTLDATITVDGGTLEGQSRDGVVFGVAEDIEPAAGFFVVKGGGTLASFTAKDMTTTAGADIVYVDGASSVRDATFSNVTSAYPIVFFSAATGVASNLLVSACTVAKSHNEGGIFASSANAPNVYDSVIENSVNTAARGNVGRQVRFFRCKVDGFTGGYDGMLFGGAMFDCFVKDYKGSRLARAANFYNCTIVGSRLTSGIIGWSGNVYNTLFYNNKNTAGTAYMSLSGDGNYYNCWVETAAGTSTKQFNCISGDDPGFKAEGDARLAASSPCIDAAATPSSPTATLTTERSERSISTATPAGPAMQSTSDASRRPATKTASSPRISIPPRRERCTRGTRPFSRSRSARTPGFPAPFRSISATVRRPSRGRFPPKAGALCRVSR